MSQVKFNSRNEVDHINNWKVLQTSWKNLGVDKVGIIIPSVE